MDAVAISVPMHTATRLAAEVAAGVRERRPALPLAAFGLYAALAQGVDRRIAGEYQQPLVEWVEQRTTGTTTDLGRRPSARPARTGLPRHDRYAMLAIGDERRLAASVETARGCASRCRHCPVPVVYDGRIRTVDLETLLVDVDQLVAAGVQHLTFADPDFLSGPKHSIAAARRIHERHPQLTFDVTTKVELILRHRAIWDELARAGCLFVTSAVECVDDAVLDVLDKGHTAADAAEAVAVLRTSGIELRPSLLPFTPWTTMASLVDLVDFVLANDLVPNVEPVHWTIRLLVPEGSLLLDRPELAPHLTGFAPNLLGYGWVHPEPAVDALQQQLAVEVEAGADFNRIAAVVCDAGGAARRPPADTCAAPRPRLTESWFCCAEPTSAQVQLVQPVRLGPSA
jgi:hypothetical protein